MKKDGKTYYLPMIKSGSPEIMGQFLRNNKSIKFIYKGKEYFWLFNSRIGVITLVNGKIHQSINFKIGTIIFFNKAKRLALYKENSKIMDINYDDVIAIKNDSAMIDYIFNLTTGETAINDYGYKYLEFREE